MTRLILTEERARASGQDAGNRSMRKAGRTAWSEDDYNAAVAEYARLLPWVDGLEAVALAAYGTSRTAPQMRSAA